MHRTRNDSGTQTMPDRYVRWRGRMHSGRSVLSAMDESQPSRTAELAAMMRALARSHSLTRRIIDDPYAIRFVGPALRLPYELNRLLLRLGAGIVFSGMNAVGLLCAVVRHRVIEDALRAAIADGFRQVVLLGAGYDTKSLRGTGRPDGMRCFELDRAATQARKRKIMRRWGMEPRAAVVYAACDVAAQDVAATLRGVGFDPQVPAVVIAEGLLPYLAAERVAGIFDEISAMGCRVRFVADYRDLSVKSADRDVVALWRRRFAAAGEPYRAFFSESEFAGMLQSAGFALRESRRCSDAWRSFMPSLRLPAGLERVTAIVTAESACRRPYGPVRRGAPSRRDKTGSILAIVNGRGGRACRRLSDRLGAMGIERAFTRWPGHAQHLAAHATDRDCLIAVGGDGTFHEVLNGADLSRQLIAVAPGGSFNMLARALGIDGVDALSSLLYSGVPTPVDSLEAEWVDAVGVRHRRRFGLFVGLGHEARMVGIAQRFPAWAGRARFFVAPPLTLATMRVESAEWATDDGPPQRMRFSSLLVHNGAVERFPSLRAGDMRDGVAEAIALCRNPLTQHLADWAALLKLRVDDPRRRRVQRVNIACTRPVAMAGDGETFGSVAGLSLRVAPRSVRLLVPAGALEE